MDLSMKLKMVQRRRSGRDKAAMRYTGLALPRCAPIRVPQTAPPGR